MKNTPQSYVLALLTLMGDQEANEENPPLGWACRWETQSSNYSLAAHRLLRALIEYPPSPEANQVVARQFMDELLQLGVGDATSILCDTLYVEYYVQVHSLNSERFDSPANWAAAVYEGLSQNGNILPLSNLAASYLNNLVIPIVNPTSKLIPRQYDESPDPDIMNQDSSSLLRSSTLQHDQVALKELVLRRDGPYCPITRYPFIGDAGTTVPPNCAHIIPFSVHNKMAVHAAIEMFTGSEVRAAEVQHLINHPRNAINMERNAQLSMDERAWGIEAKLVNNEWKYYFHVVRRAKVYGTIRLHDGDEINFGDGGDGDSIQLPDPRLCNLHLAIARVFMVSGFTEVIDRLFKDWDDGANDELWPGID